MEIRFYVDDGNVIDLKIAKLLEKYGFTGIFYIAPFYTKIPIMSVAQIQELAKKHEIGGHTLNHTPLSKMNSTSQINEILAGKKELESIIGKEITKFAYPRGHYTQEAMHNVEMCGFKEARTMKQWCIGRKGYTEFEIPVTLHFYPGKYENWRNLFEQAKKHNGYFGVVCHGVEMHRYDLWENYEEMLEYVQKNQVA